MTVKTIDEYDKAISEWCFMRNIMDCPEDEEEFDWAAIRAAELKTAFTEFEQTHFDELMMASVRRV